MTALNLSLVLLGLSAAFFVTSVFSRRTASKSAMIHLLRKGLAVIILALAAFYFYQRIKGS